MTLASPNPHSSELYRLRQLEMIAARWDTKADLWDRDLEDPGCHLNEDDAYRRFLSEVNSVVDDCREFCAQHGVVDLSCGPGLVLSNLILSFEWGAGIDISREMIRVAKAKNIPRAQFFLGDGFQLPKLVPRAGAILSRGVLLSHYGQQHAKELLRAARSSLVEGGFLVLDFLNEAAEGQFLHQPEQKTFYNGREVCQLAKDGGFGRTRILGAGSRRVLLLLAHAE